jgi:hypothetical protein
MHKTKLALVMLAWGVVIALSMLKITKTIPYAYIHNDFYVYYIAAKLLADDNPIYGVSEAFKQIKSDNNLLFHWSTGYVYPPLTAISFVPLTFLPSKLAAWIWFGLNLLLFSLWINWIMKKYPSRWSIFYILTFPPAIYSLTSGQMNFIILWLLSFYILDEKPIKKNLGLGLAILIKVYPSLFLIGELIAGRIRQIYNNVLVIALGIVIPVLLGQSKNTLDYFRRVLPALQANRDSYFIHQSATSVLLRFTISPDKINSFLPDSEIRSLTFVVSAFVMSNLLIWTVKRKAFRLVEKLVWLNCISLVSGRMTYWNFLPTILGSLYLLKNENLLNRFQKVLLWVSIILSNLAWQFSYWFYQNLPVNNWWQTMIFAFSTSVGFLSVLIQSVILVMGFNKSESPSQPQKIPRKF